LLQCNLYLHYMKLLNNSCEIWTSDPNMTAFQYSLSKFAKWRLDL
jgi:hypothetical protein